MSRLMEEVLEVSESAESLSPEGWVRLEQRGWILRRLHRTGTFAAAGYIKDEELAAQIGGREGLNRTLMEIAITPSLKLAWDEAVLRAQLVLEGNPVWQQGLEQWLTEREVEEPRDYRLRLYGLQGIVGLWPMTTSSPPPSPQTSRRRTPSSSASPTPAVSFSSRCSSTRRSCDRNAQWSPSVSDGSHRKGIANSFDQSERLASPMPAYRSAATGSASS